MIVVCDGSVSPPDPLPHRKLVDTFAQVFSESAVAVHHAYWVSEIEEGATWWCYPDLECNGSVPDPTASELAATAACMGSVTYASKADIRTTLEPVDSASPAARAEQIKAALAQEQDEAVAQQLLDDLVQRVRDGKWALEEDRLVDLAVALKNVRVRDGCLHPEVTSIGRPIEEAWAELVRALPDPYRAEPACLLALTAFLRGDGVMAGVAVDLAIESDPDHSFAKLLRTSMDYGLPPDSVAAAVAQAFTDPAEPAKTHVPRPPITDGPRSLEIHASDPSNPHPPDNAQPPNE
ncbi:hypothetical protein H4W33_010188 [Kibdelosporangium phytohabitans]|nr:hypothetical protein [Kibdelosporangium phytohabitans]